MTVHEIRLERPRVSGREVSFAWSVEPRSELYRAHRFFLRFPESLDLSTVPGAFWDRISLLCLHSHWAILRPCRVRIPFSLEPAEREAWNRWIDAQVATLEAHRGTSQYERSVELLDEPGLPSVFAPSGDSDRCAAAFSGGKDSLLQAGLLAELTDRPILVATTSPMPPLHDHVTSRRREVFEEIRRRRPVVFVEVESDFRTAWENEFPRRLGYGPAINELCDTHLYAAALLAAGFALGARHFFVASEAELQQNSLLDGRIIQHPHAMYSAPSLRAIEAIFTPAGVRLGSLTYPLRSAQVQQLLWTRYADICDLQYSCWRVPPGKATCSRCAQCFRLALNALALRRDPERMGIDLVVLLREMADWKPAFAAPGATLPNDVVRESLNDQTLRSIAEVSVPWLFLALFGRRPWRLVDPRAWKALLCYGRLRQRVPPPAGGSQGYRAGYLPWIDPLLRDRVAAIFDARFEREEGSESRDLAARSETLANWITEPLL